MIRSALGTVSKSVPNDSDQRSRSHSIPRPFQRPASYELRTSCLVVSHCERVEASEAGLSLSFLITFDLGCPFHITPHFVAPQLREEGRAIEFTGGFVGHCSMTDTNITAPCPSSSTSVVVSAPGKLLLAGGYLVLDEGNVGLTIGVDARFYASCTLDPVSAEQSSSTEAASVSTSASESVPAMQITVVSPQMEYTEWHYTWQNNCLSTSGGNQSNDKKNPFVEKALRVALLFLNPQSTSATSTMTTMKIVLVADNDFYSLVPHLQERNMPCTLEAAQTLPRRLPVARDPQTHAMYKTGLGSSACLVAALTGSLVHAFEKAKNPSQLLQQQQQHGNQLENVISRLAQIGHCHAQGKIGSGFDVSAACFGSHVYQRFSSAALNPILQALEHEQPLEENGTSANEAATTTKLLQETVFNDSIWQGAGVTAPLHCFSSHTFLQVIMADVSGGSESPSMAKSVLAWKKQQSEETQNGAVPHWDDLKWLNRHAVELLQQIHSVQPMADIDIQQPLIDCPPDQWATAFVTSSSSVAVIDDSKAFTLAKLATLLHDLYETFRQIRFHLKAMGDAAKVPIEPEPQTLLCNTCATLPGVIAALVPGAGGYDAVACLYIHTPATQAAVANLWASWGKESENGGNQKSSSVCALSVSGVDYGDGLRIEDEFPSIACAPRKS